MIPFHSVRLQPARAPRAVRWLAVLLGLAAVALHAQQPTGGTVVAGSATIATGANSTVITAGDNSVLRWNSFDVGTGETVQFVQPGASSRVLNWIGGATPSQINGSLLANGQVYLMNPSGVYFGQTAVINVGALYAVGGTMTKDDFLSGLNRFSGLTGDVINAGSIRGEMVALVGRSVANSGSIVSPGGFIGLASGEQVLLGQNGSSIYVDAGRSGTAGPVAEGTGVANTGTIDSGAGSTVLAAGDLYSIAITQDGRLAGRDVRLQGQGRGDVLVSGTIDASSPTTTGGHVEITGERVGLTGSASVDASGATGGGTILVGGDFQGGNAEIRNAASTYVGSGVSLLADATQAGNGGKVIVWADGVTRFAGNISGRGGPAGGNGGFAEVSGKSHLSFRGAADLRAINGTLGTLLLDPDDIIIASAGPDLNGDTTTGDDVVGNILSTDFPGQVSVITSGEVSNILGSASLSLAATSSITVNSAVTWSAATTLSLNAGSSIAVNAAINGGALGAVSLTSGSTISLGSSLTGATISLNHAGGLSRSAGTVTATTLNLNGAGDVGTGGANLVTDAGTIILNKAGGNTFINDIGTLAVQGTTAGDLTAVAASSASVSGATTVSGSLDLTAGGSITQSGALTVSTFTTLNAGSNAITLDNASNNFGGTLGVTQAGDVTIVDLNALDIGPVTASGNLSLSTGGNITTGGPVVVTGTTALAAGSGNDITLVNTGNNFGGAVSISSGNNVSLVDSNALALGAATVAGNLNVKAGSHITQTGALSVAGTSTVEVTAAGSDILLGTQTNDLGTSALVFGGTVANIRDFSLQNTNVGATLPNLASLTNLRSLTLVLSGVPVALPALTLGTGGNLSVTAGGIITQAGALVVPGTASFSTGGFGITLTDAGNTFTGAVSLTNTLTNNISVFNATSLVLGGVSMGDGALAATALNGSISQAGAITKTGGTSTFTIDTGTNRDILLHTSANNFGGGAVTFTTANAGTIQDIGLQDASATASLAGLPTSARNIDLLFTGKAIDLPGLTATGHLNVTAGGAITQSAALSVGGTTTFAAGSSNNITLNNASNSFGSAVAITSGNNVTLVDSGAIDLAASTVSGNLDVSAAGAITDSGNLSVTGTTTLAAGSGNNITLDASNNFGGAVAISSGNNVTLVDSGAIDLAGSTVSGSLNVTASGAITDSGNLSVTGTTTLAAGSGNDITLDASNNFGGAVAISNGNNVTLVDSGAIDLAGSTVSGNLSVTASGAITDSGNLSVTGTTTLAAGSGNNITLDASNNFGGAVAISSGNNVTLVDTGAITFAASTVSGNLDVDAGGLIDQTGALTVTGTSNFTTGNAAIALDNASNDFTGAVSLNNAGAFNVAIKDVNALTIDTSLVGSGTLTVDAAAVTLAGAITSGNTVTFNNTGALTGTGLVTASTQVNFAGSGDAGSSGSRINTSTPSIDVTTAGGADTFVSNQRDGGVTLTGNTTAGNSTVAVTSRNTANDARDAVTIGVGNLVNSGTGSSVALIGSSLTLNGGITSPTITLDFAGDLTGSGTLAAAVALQLEGTGNVGSSGSLISINTPSLILNKSSGDVFVNNGANALTLSETLFNGTGVFTSGAFALGSSITTAGDLTFNTSTFDLGANAVTGSAVTINNSGALTGTGLVTATTLNLNGLGAVGVDAANRIATDAGTITFNKGATAGATFLAEANGATLSGSTQGAVNITTTTGTLTLSGLTAAGGFTAPGAALALTGTITGPMSLGSNVSLSADATFSGAVTLTNGITITTGANTLTFNSGVDGAFALIVNAAGGAVEFFGGVGATTPLTSLSVTGLARVSGTIRTDGNTQNWGNLVLTADATFTDATGDINFNGTIDGDGNGPWALTANTQFNTLFAGVVGGTQALASVTTDAGGTTAINGGAVTTTGAQTYNDDVTIGTAAATLTTTNSTVDFAGTTTLNQDLTVS
ncbi:MAG TPA: filamentous hemagglutinin N-terminal domain-containing protein, partial [Lacunisphaera sp.]